PALARSRVLREAAGAARRRRRVGGGAGGAVRRVQRLQPARPAAHPLPVKNGQIQIRDAGVSYRLYREKVSTLKEAVVNRFRHLKSAEMFWALRHISLTIHPGEAIALVGHNGSGKSTLLKTIAGVLQTSEGEVRVEGR